MDVLDRFDNLPEGVQEIIKEKVWELEAEEDLEIWNTWYKYYHDVVAAELTLIVGARTQDPECNGVWSEEEVAASVAAYEASQADIDRQNEILALQARLENDFINAALSDGESTASQIIKSIKAGL